MTRRLTTVLLVVVALTFCVQIPASMPLQAQDDGQKVYIPIVIDGLPPPVIPGQFVVLWRPEASTAAVENGTQLATADPAPSLDMIDVSAMLAAGDDKTIDALLESYRNNPDVLAVEPNYVYSIDQAATDPNVNQQWAWGRINAPAAWAVTRGDPAVVIAVIDTGIQTNHPDLDAKIVPGYDFVQNDADASDGNGHGTHVAGSAAAETNNNLGGAGMCPNCRLMPIRVLGDGGSGSLANVARGIIYAADNGARVVNLSLGGGGATTLQNAVNYAWSKGVFLACAAGNSNTNRFSYPAAYDNCFAVAATTSNDARASFSNYGSWVEIAAPGSQIFSTYTGARYGTLSGTSMAAPHVAGLAGLLASQGLSNTQIRDRLCASADRIAGTGSAWTCGRINADRAVRGTNLTPLPTTTTPAPTTTTPAPTTTTPAPTPPTTTPVPSPSPVPNNRLLNGGFEDGTTGWQFSTSDLLSDRRPLSGVRSVRLGGEDASTDAIEQVVVVPANGMLSYSWSPDGPNDMGDTLKLEITTVDVANVRLSISLNANSGRWYQRSINLAGLAGRTIKVRFSAQTNAAAPTAFYLDNVSLR
jgi:subtilisin family serine protease